MPGIGGRGRWRLAPVVAFALLLTGCAPSPSVASIRVLPTDTGPAPAVSDTGTTGDIAAVKHTVQRALTTELQVFNVDEHGIPLVSAAQRTAMIDAVEAGPQRTELRDALADIGEPPFRQGGHFVIERWEGVQVVQDQARAFVSGHSAYTPTAVSSQQRDGTWQYQVLLTRAGGTWRVTHERAASHEQG